MQVEVSLPAGGKKRDGATVTILPDGLPASGLHLVTCLSLNGVLQNPVSDVLLPLAWFNAFSLSQDPTQTLGLSAFSHPGLQLG